MSTTSCPHCAAPRQAGHVICGYCREPYDAAAAARSIQCARCGTRSAEGQDKCVGCGAWIVVSCLFCGAHSPYTKSACVSCGELFAGSAERKARMEAEQAAAHDDDEEDGWEDGWAWCEKCQALVYDEDPAGRCAAGGKHETGDSESYYLCTSPEEADGQGGWRWCKGCQGLFLGGVRAGVCVAGGQHDGSESEEYVVSRESDDDYDEDAAGWSQCKRCSAMVWADDEGRCPAGGGHQVGKTDYSIPYED
jgi:LSD1 subclass zinc finger protein